jgi:hypothetical protein
MASAYFPKSICKKYIVIKNTVIAKILISDGVGRDKVVSPQDRNKMSMIGLISYIVYFLICFFYLVIRVMMLSINYRGIDNDFMYLLYYIDLMILWGLGILIILIVLINTWNCGKQRL